MAARRGAVEKLKIPSNASRNSLPVEYPGLPAAPGGALDRDPRLPKAHPGAEPAEISIPLGHGGECLDHPPGEQGEIARVNWKSDVGQGGDEAIEQVVAGAEEPPFLAADTRGVDDVEPEAVLLDEARDLLRWIL